MFLKKNNMLYIESLSLKNNMIVLGGYGLNYAPSSSSPKMVCQNSHPPVSQNVTLYGSQRSLQIQSNEVRLDGA